MGPKRIAAVAAVAMFAGVAPPARAAVPDLERTSATQLEAMLNAGELTSVQLTRAYINRIAAVNARGPGLNAVRVLNPRALQDARVLDLERAHRPRPRPARRRSRCWSRTTSTSPGLPTTAASSRCRTRCPTRTRSSSSACGRPAP